MNLAWAKYRFVSPPPFCGPFQLMKKPKKRNPSGQEGRSRRRFVRSSLFLPFTYSSYSVSMIPNGFLDI